MNVGERPDLFALRSAAETSEGGQLHDESFALVDRDDFDDFHNPVVVPTGYRLVM
jgi:hypothetical protein